MKNFMNMCQSQSIKSELSLTGSLSVRLGSELHQRMTIVTVQYHLSINRFIKDALNAALGNNEAGSYRNRQISIV